MAHTPNIPEAFPGLNGKLNEISGLIDFVRMHNSVLLGSSTASKRQETDKLLASIESIVQASRQIVNRPSDQ